MSSRRIVSSEKSMLDKGGVDGSSTDRSALATANVKATPQISRAVVSKLLAFTFAMITAPIGSYFLTIHKLYNGNSTYAGATAAVVANAVLLAYVIAAIQEDDADQKESKKNK